MIKFSDNKFLGYVLSASVLILDQSAKWLIVQFHAGKPSVPIIPNFFNLIYTTNPGAAWGFFGNYTAFLTAASLLVMAVLIWRFESMVQGWRERAIGLGILLGGVMGNLIDRIFRGEVVDFIDLHYRGYHWPAFNIADAAICVGIGLYVVSVLWRNEENSG